MYEYRVVNGVPGHHRAATNILNAWSRHGWEIVQFLPNSHQGGTTIVLRRPNENPPLECFDLERNTWYDKPKRVEGE